MGKLLVLAIGAVNVVAQTHALGKLDDALLEWPLPAGDQRYAAIDGRHVHQYVGEQAAISLEYRDQGHPKFWGRIIGTSGDARDAEWLAAKFRAIGLADVRIQPVPLDPQWMPRSWEVSIRSGGKVLNLDSAQPDYGANGTSAELDLDAVYVGLGSEADFAGRDVRGKAVFTFSELGMKPEGAVKRADQKGAAAIFEVNMLPGNLRYQAYPSGTQAPAFTLGSVDGYAARDLIAASADRPARVKVRLDVERVPNLKTALVWGTLPGASDETIYVIAHRDGWFQAAGDNAGGVAAMIGLAEYYAKIPRAERRRTMVFIGLDGHHNTGPGSGAGRRWLVEHRSELFDKTALMINCEHPATLQTYAYPHYQEERGMVWTDTVLAQQWYAGGPSRPELQAITVKAFHEFGAPLDLDPDPRPPAGDLGQFFRFLPGVATSEFYQYFHTDQETPEVVPWTGLEATTRAYAKIIDEVNKLPLGALKRPPEPER